MTGGATPKAWAFMGFVGLVASEYSSGGHTSRGHVTKAGNEHLHTQLVESAWAYQRGPYVGYRIRGELELAARKNVKTVVAAAVARELAGFLWGEMSS